MNKKYFGLLALVSITLAHAIDTASILPTGEGTYLTWTPSTGSTHYTLVDETTCNGTTDYVSTKVVNNRDSYTVDVSSVPDGAVITAVSLTPCASKAASGGTDKMKVFYRLNGTNSADSAEYTLSGTTPTNLVTRVYSGLSVVKTSTTTLESGAVFTSGSKGARLSRLATVVTYVVAPVSAPTNVSAVASTSPTRAVISWTSSTTDVITGFSVEKGTDGINFTVATTTSSLARSYSDTAVASSTTYYYRIRSVNQAGYSPYSATTSVTMP
jgi:hypothetical protein